MPSWRCPLRRCCASSEPGRLGGKNGWAVVPGLGTVTTFQLLGRRPRAPRPPGLQSAGSRATMPFCPSTRTSCCAHSSSASQLSLLSPRSAGTQATMRLHPSTRTSWCRTCTTTRHSIKRVCCFPVLAAVQSWFAAAVASMPGSMHNGPSFNQTWVHLICVPLSLRLGATASPAGALLPTHTAAVAARCVARVGVPPCMHQAG